MRTPSHDPGSKTGPVLACGNVCSVAVGWLPVLPAMEEMRLLPDPESLDEAPVALHVLALEVIEQATPLAHQHHETTA